MDRGEGINATPWPLYTQEGDLVSFVQEAGWTPGLAWTDVESLAPHWDLIPGPSSP